jgi:exo-beta-1,3-glucanase (GH17 family)
MSPVQQIGLFNFSPITLFQQQRPSILPLQSSSLKVVVPEKSLIIVGWPTGSGSINSSIAGTSELEYFIPQFLSAAKNAGVKYYFFEGYDEPWKVIFNTATEHYEDTWVISLL